MFRTIALRQARLFSTTTRLGKGPVEVGKDALKTVDRTVSDAAVKGIETGGMFLHPPSLLPSGLSSAPHLSISKLRHEEVEAIFA
jgi:hypothetical protein